MYGGQVTEYSKLSDFYYIKENALDKEFCDHCIKKFKDDDNKKQGTTGSGLLLDIKQSIDLNISSLDYWKEEDLVFYNSLNDGLRDYENIHKDTILFLNCGDYTDSGYQIQETMPGGFYSWHHDYFVKNEMSRILTYIWYLNDVEEGGYTEFVDGFKVQPKTGTLLIFPATWTFYHQGTPPLETTKYICTGWIYFKSTL